MELTDYNSAFIFNDLVQTREILKSQLDDNHNIFVFNDEVQDHRKILRLISSIEDVMRWYGTYSQLEGLDIDPEFK